MWAYLDIVSTILNTGRHKPNRTGIDTLSCFDLSFKHDMADGFPLLTTKAINWQAVVYELLWFLSGESSIALLQKRTSIWNSWADSSGNLESAYGYFWRHFPVVQPSDIETTPGKYAAVDGSDVGFDQIRWVIRELRRNPNSRRLVVSAWHPQNAWASRLPPCHMLYVFNVQGETLNLHMTQRSCDVGVGLPFNIASYALLLHLMARCVSLRPGRLSISLVDAHIYYVDPADPTIDSPFGPVTCMRKKRDYDHVAPLRIQLTRAPKQLPSLVLEGNADLDDIVQRHFYGDEPLANSIRLVGYDPHPSIVLRAAV